MAKPADCHLEATLSTDADRLEAAGIPLRIGERDVRVRFTMRSMKALETRYGSLRVVNEEIKSLLDYDEDGNPKAEKPFTTLLPLVTAGLLHEQIDEDALGDALSPARYVEVRRALVDAINESFPDSGKAEEGDQGAIEEPPGATSTTSPPSDSVVVMASSGV